MATSKKPGKPERIIVDIPRSIWELTKEEKAKLRRKFKAALVEVKGVAGEEGVASDEGDLTPTIDNT